MTKKDIVKLVACKANITNTQASDAVEATIEAIKDAVKEHKDVTIRGFGAFKYVLRKSKKARNIKTGTEVVIPSKLVLKFKPSAEIKEMKLFKLSNTTGVF